MLTIGLWWEKYNEYSDTEIDIDFIVYFRVFGKEFINYINLVNGIKPQNHHMTSGLHTYVTQPLHVTIFRFEELPSNPAATAAGQ